MVMILGALCAVMLVVRVVLFRRRLKHANLKADTFAVDAPSQPWHCLHARADPSFFKQHRGF